MTADVAKGRRSFLLLAALFFAPVIAALLLYFVFPQWQPGAKTYHGRLIDPARQLPDLRLVDADGQARDQTALRGRWSFVYVAESECGSACRAELFQVRQIRTLLNEKRQRVQRVYLARSPDLLPAARQLLGAEHPDLLYLAPTADSGDAMIHYLGPVEPDAIYLTDPLGNLLMTYPAGTEYKGILKDLKKLLRLSQIG